MWGPMRARSWIWGSAFSLAMLASASKGPPTIGWDKLNPFGNDKGEPKAENIQTLKMASSLKFGKSTYTFGQDEAIDALAYEDDLDQKEVLSTMAQAYRMDTLTTEQVVKARANTPFFIDDARDKAVEMLRADYEMDTLVTTYHRVTSKYRERRRLWGILSKPHGGYDIKYAAYEPISSSKDLQYVGHWQTRSGLNVVSVKDGKKTLDIIHVEELDDNAFKEGDLIPAGTPFARQDGRVGRKYRSTGTHAHIQMRDRSDPTAYAQQFVVSKGFTAKRKTLPGFLAKELKEADGVDFMAIGKDIDALRDAKKISKKRAKQMHAAYAKMTDFVNAKADSIIRAGVEKDEMLMAAAFADDENLEALATNIMPSKRHKDRMLTASIFGAVDLSGVTKNTPAVVSVSEKSLAVNKAVEEYVETAEEATAISDGKAWTSVYKTPNRRAEKLSQILRDQKIMDLAVAETGVAEEEIVSDLIGLIGDHENGAFNPQEKNGRSSAISFGQHTIDNRNTLYRTKRFNLPKFPKYKELNTEEGVKVSAQYLIANYATNYAAAKEDDKKFKAKHDGRGLYDQTYIRKDNGKPVFMTYRRGVTAGWGGIYGFNKILASEQKEAMKKDKPYAKFACHMAGQNFTSYVDIADAGPHPEEAEATATIQNDPALTKYYKPAKKIAVAERKSEEVKIAFKSLMTTQAAEIVAPPVNADSTAPAGTHLKYEYK